MIYRKPTFGDIEAIFEMVNNYADEGVMLARSRNTLYETIRDMIVAEDATGKIVTPGLIDMHVHLRLDLGSLYIGGCTLERHWRNVEAAECAGMHAAGYRRGNRAAALGRRPRPWRQAVHHIDLQARFFPDIGIPHDYEGAASPQGLEGMHRLPEIPEL